MRIDESRERQENLEIIIKEMALSSMDDDALSETALKLKELYSHNFRHSYSAFYPIIIDISSDDNEYSSEYLCNNITRMREIVEEDYFTNEERTRKYSGLYFPLMKLADHINLEIGRYNQITVHEKKLSDIEKQNNVLQETLTNTREQLTLMSEKVQNAQREYIAILGIFAAIVLAVTGSFSFTAAAFQSINDVSIYRIAFVVLIIGLILVNINISLFYHIDRIVRGKANTIVAPLLISNITIIVLLLATILAWKFDWLKVQTNEPTQTTQEYTYINEVEEKGGSLEYYCFE